jgi:hypothetical protein
MNNCLRKTIAFNYMGKEVEAILNLADGFVDVFAIEEGEVIKYFPRIKKYLKDEGFFD